MRIYVALKLKSEAKRDMKEVGLLNREKILRIPVDFLLSYVAP